MSFVKTPCKHCPFRTDVQPFLSPEMGQTIAYSATNKYSDFKCHKTYSHEDDRVVGDNQLTCAGFLTVRASETGEIPEGFDLHMKCVILMHLKCLKFTLIQKNILTHEKDTITTPSSTAYNTSSEHHLGNVFQFASLREIKRVQN